jgi:phage terminase large subunit GpA-like protein
LAVVLADIRASALRALIPPPRLHLSEWIERELRLPEGVSALPGRVKLWPYQTGIADAISDPTIERISLTKATRVGFTTILTGAIASYIANEPSAILALLPTESDARDYVVSDIEPIFAATPALRGALSGDTEEGDRNTLLHRRFAGGSLKVVAARAPRNLRRHTARILIVDEADACESGPEGNPIRLAERRTLTYANRKIIVGSTPIFVDTSHVLRSYAESDARIFEVPCPECGGFTEITWGEIEWQPDRPETAAFRCPACKALIAERHKASMVTTGRWRITRPEVRGHAGFRLNALVSLLPNASWAKLAAEFLAAKDDSAELQVFTNTVLAQGWAAPGAELDEVALAGRAEDFDLEHIPAEVLILTAGADLQEDRIEVTIVGWTRESVALVLGHVVIWGAPTSDDTAWLELDELLKSKWRHRYGGRLSIDVCVIDSGFATEDTYGFCFPKFARRIWAGKGMAGSRPALQQAKIKTKSALHGGRLFLVGVDTLKQTIFQRLQHGRSIRFSKALEPVYYEQLASERRVIRYVKGRPVRRFERKSERARAEALDCLCYAFAARSGITIPFEQRVESLRSTTKAASGSLISQLAK